MHTITTIFCQKFVLRIVAALHIHKDRLIFVLFAYLTEGKDYVGPSGVQQKVKFAAGVTHQSFTIKIINDMIVEKTESFRITIFPLSVPRGIYFGDFPSAIVEIIDDDGKYVYIAIMYYYVNAFYVRKRSNIM